MIDRAPRDGAAADCSTGSSNNKKRSGGETAGEELAATDAADAAKDGARGVIDCDQAEEFVEPMSPPSEPLSRSYFREYDL